MGLLGGLGLAELDRNIGSTIRSNRPCGRHVAVRTEDVGAVFGAVHEHRVELRVVDTTRPPADVLADLRTEVAAKVLLHAAVMLERHVGRSEVRGLAPRDVVQAAAPRERWDSFAGAVWVGQALLRRVDYKRRAGGSACRGAGFSRRNGDWARSRGRALLGA